MPPIILSTAKWYYKDKELTKKVDIPVDFETMYVSRTYDFFDKILEFTTSIIVSKEAIYSYNYGTEKLMNKTL